MSSASLSEKMVHWLSTVLLIHLNLVADIRYHFEEYARFGGEAPFLVFYEAAALPYIFLLATGLVWHLLDFSAQQKMRSALGQTLLSYWMFGSCLTALIAALWLYRTTSYADYHGFWTVPAPVAIATYSLLLATPILALLKLAAFIFVQIQRLTSAAP